MALNTLPRFTNGIRAGAVEISTAATLATLAVGGTDGSVIESLGITSTDSSAETLELFLENTASATFQIGAIAIAATSGTDGTTAPVNGLNTTDMPFLTKNAHSMPILNLPEGYSLKAQVAALTAGKVITVYCGIRDYTE